MLGAQPRLASAPAAAPAFTTSTLQQEAARRLGLSPKRTMALLQRLYTDGHITYHRTDSVALSASFVEAACAVVAAAHGPAMVQRRDYARTATAATAGKKGKRQKKGGAPAQEAHEAVRPTKPVVAAVEGEGAALSASCAGARSRPVLLARVATVALRLRATDATDGVGNRAR